MRNNWGTITIQPTCRPLMKLSTEKSWYRKMSRSSWKTLDPNLNGYREVISIWSKKIYILKFWLKISKNSSYLVFASTLGHWIWDLSGSIWHNVAVYEKWNITKHLLNHLWPISKYLIYIHEHVCIWKEFNELTKEGGIWNVWPGWWPYWGILWREVPGISPYTAWRTQR